MICFLLRLVSLLIMATTTTTEQINSQLKLRLNAQAMEIIRLRQENHMLKLIEHDTVFKLDVEDIQSNFTNFPDNILLKNENKEILKKLRKKTSKLNEIITRVFKVFIIKDTRLSRIIKDEITKLLVEEDYKPFHSSRLH